MTRDDLQVDRRTLLRATSFLASIPADVGTVWATATAGEGTAGGSGDGSGLGPAPSFSPGPVGYAYGGAPVAATADGTTDDDPQGYGEYGYGGTAP